MDGTPNYTQVDAFVNTTATLLPQARGLKAVEAVMPKGLTVASKLNAAQFSRAFKGTIISRAAPATRGFLNRNLNKGINYINGQIGTGMKTLPVVKGTGNLVKPNEDK